MSGPSETVAPDPPAALAGRVLVGGPRARAAYQQMVARAGAGALALARVAWDGGRLVLAGDDPGADPFALCFAPLDEAGAAWFRTRHLNVLYEGPLTPLVAKALEFVRRRMGDVPLARLLNPLLTDPETRDETPPPPVVADEGRDGAGPDGSAAPGEGAEGDAPGRAIDGADPFVGGFGDPLAAVRFFATQELARSAHESVDIGRRATHVQHGDLECAWLKPSPAERFLPWLHRPWERRERRLPLGRGRTEAEARPADAESGPPAPSMLTTNLREADVVAGGLARLTAALDQAIARTDAEFIYVHDTCIPAVSSEDSAAVIRRAAAASPVPVICESLRFGTLQTVFRDLLVTRRVAAQTRLAAEAGTAARASEGVNLVGFPATRERADLAALLAAAGVPVNVTLIPEVPREAIDRFPRAAVSVLCPNEAWDTFYEQLAVDATVPAIAPAAPYGWAATRAWLDTVTTALGRADAAAAAWRDETDALAASWERLCGRAHGRRFGFVLTEGDIARLATPAATWGIPVVAALREAGFALDALVFAPAGADGDALAARAAGVLGASAAITTFGTPGELPERLRDADWDAVYSDHASDRRAAMAGKAVFSLKDFAPGPRGAIDTLRRLLSRVHTPFYRRYGRFLGAAATGPTATGPTATGPTATGPTATGPTATGGEPAE